MIPIKVTFAKEYLQRFYASLSRWEIHHQYYLEEFVPRLQQAVCSGDVFDLKPYSAGEIALMRALKQRLDAEEWSNLAHSLSLLYRGQTPSFASDERLQQRIADLQQAKHQLQQREQALQAYSGLPAKLREQQRRLAMQKIAEQQGQLSLREQALRAYSHLPVRLRQQQMQHLLQQLQERQERLSGRELLLECIGQQIRTSQQRQILQLMQQAYAVRTKQAGQLQQLLQQDFLHYFRRAAEIDNLQFGHDELQQLRVAFVRDWCLQHLQLRVDEQQALAIAHHQGNVLVEARAGSGKTRVLVSRAIFLIKHCNLEAGGMLLLAFNRTAAKTMYKRLHEHLHGEMPHVMTFHALAWRICVNRMPQLAGLRLSSYHDEHQGKLKKQIKYIIEHSLQQLSPDMPKSGNVAADSFALWQGIVRNPELQDHELLGSVQDLLLEYFSDDSDYFVTLEEYFAGQPSSHNKFLAGYKALDGEHYGSYMAAQLANFAVEHELYVSKCELPHDFELTPSSSLLRFYQGSSKLQVYLLMVGRGHGRTLEWFENKMRSRFFHRDTRVLVFSENSFDSREELKRHLLGCFAAWSLPLHKLSPQQLWKKFHTRIIDSFSEVCGDFIGRAVKYDIDAHELRHRLQKHECLDRNEEVFLQCILPLYEHYLQLRDNMEPDFDRLCQLSCDLLRQGGAFSYQCQFARKERMLELGKITYVSVDEFQDFNELFYQMLVALAQANPAQQLFAVGDNWQAINAFAGSNLCYFENFAQYFKHSTKLYLTTNYRSAAGIVELGNRLMRGRGAEAVAHNRDAGEIYLWDLYEFDLEELQGRERDLPGENVLAEPCSCRKHDCEQPCVSEGTAGDALELSGSGCWQEVRRHVNYRDCQGFVALLHALVTLSKDGEKMLLLGRTNKPAAIYDLPQLQQSRQERQKDKNSKPKPMTKEQWEQSLLPYFTSRQALNCSTVHSSKGDESEAVLLMDLFQGHFPLIRKEWVFLRVLGVDLPGLIEEERRLLYVALSRAKNRLGIIYNAAKPGGFLPDLGLQSCKQHDWWYCYRKFVLGAGYASLRLIDNRSTQRHSGWLTYNGFKLIYRDEEKKVPHFWVKDIEMQPDYLEYLQRSHWPELQDCRMYVYENTPNARQRSQALRFIFRLPQGWLQLCDDNEA